MSRFASRFSVAAALAATISMVATPAFAAPLPAVAAPVAPMVYSATAHDGAVQNRYRGWSQYGRYHNRHRGGIDGGDVLAGVLVLGGIAAIASAASNSNRNHNRDYRDDYRYRNDTYRYRDSQPRSQDNYQDGYDRGYRDGQDASNGSGYRGSSADEGQWNDDAYARARDSQDPSLAYGQY